MSQTSYRAAPTRRKLLRGHQVATRIVAARTARTFSVFLAHRLGAGIARGEFAHSRCLLGFSSGTLFVHAFTHVGLHSSVPWGCGPVLCGAILSKAFGPLVFLSLLFTTGSSLPFRRSSPGVNRPYRSKSVHIIQATTISLVWLLMSCESQPLREPLAIGPV
jgi:hypothetical protein